MQSMAVMVMTWMGTGLELNFHGATLEEMNHSAEVSAVEEEEGVVWVHRGDQTTEYWYLASLQLVAGRILRIT